MRNVYILQRGMGIVEVMVGILIGLIVVLAIYNIFSIAEGYKRTTIGAADAQTTGLFAQFVLSREISNAGNGISGDGAGLATQSDSLVVSYSTAPKVVSGMLLVDKAMALVSDPLYVQSPNGFQANDL